MINAIIVHMVSVIIPVPNKPIATQNSSSSHIKNCGWLSIYRGIAISFIAASFLRRAAFLAWGLDLSFITEQGYPQFLWIIVRA